MVVVVLLSVGLGWFAIKLREAERQRKAVEKIKEAGGWVRYDYEVDKFSVPIAKPEPPATAWLTKLVGDDFFSDVAGVNLYDTKFGDAGLGHLKEMTRMEWLCLDGTQVTDVGLKHLTGLTELERLDFFGTQITDVGLEYLKGLTQLEWLALTATHISDVGLENLKGLTRLKYLVLDEAHVTEEGIEEFRKALPNCEVFRDDPNN